jgi:hypothetical protein
MFGHQRVRVGRIDPGTLYNIGNLLGLATGLILAIVAMNPSEAGLQASGAWLRII